MPRQSLIIAALTATAVLATGSARAWANGAFPDTQAVLLPSGDPQRIIVATNFGLVFSEDDGQTWQYSCEGQATTNGHLYAQGPGPDQRLFALSDVGTTTSADQGCTWILGGGAFTGGRVLDYFADPVNPRRVLVVAQPPSADGILPAALFESQDGGINYGPALFTAPTGGGITGVEIAASDPTVTYLTTFTVNAGDTVPHPRLQRSSDGGATWTAIDLEPALGPTRVTLAAVDSGDANRIFLRVGGTSSDRRPFDAIAVSVDGGQTFSVPVELTGGTLTTFLARRNGTILVSGLQGTTVVGFRSSDGGQTFTAWQPGLHPRGLGERGTTLFAAADTATDGFALASSEDNGATWTPRMRFGDIQAVRSCVYRACVIDCQRQVSLGLFPPAVCQRGAGAGAGSDASDGDATDAAPRGASKATGCGACSAADQPPAGGLATVAAVAILVCMRPRRRASGPRRRRRFPGALSVSLPLLWLSLGASAPAFGYARSQTAGGVPYHWDTRCIPVDVHLGALPGLTDDEMRAAVLGAARTWSAENNPCTDLSIVVSFSDGPGPATGNDGVNVVGARPDGWCVAEGDGTTAPAPPAGQSCNSPSAMAATSVFAAHDGHILGGDTQLNTLTMAWAALDDDGQPADRHDLQSALTHEFGHLLGLDHPCWSGIGARGTDDQGAPLPNCYDAPDAILQDTMFPLIEPGDRSRRMLSPDTQRALCELYPAPAGSVAAAPVAACPAGPAPGGCDVNPAAPAPSWQRLLLLVVAAMVFTRRRDKVSRHDEDVGRTPGIFRRVFLVRGRRYRRLPADQ